MHLADVETLQGYTTNKTGHGELKQGMRYMFDNIPGWTQVMMLTDSTEMPDVNVRITLLPKVSAGGFTEGLVDVF